MRVMRAKLEVESVESHEVTESETLKFHAVGMSGTYPEDGSDEDNTFARFTPAASLEMCVQNPDLIGKFKPGQKFYVDFTEAE